MKKKQKHQEWYIETTHDFSENFGNSKNLVKISVTELLTGKPAIRIAAWVNDDIGYIMDLDMEKKGIREGTPTFELGLLIAKNLPVPLTLEDLQKLGFELF